MNTASSIPTSIGFALMLSQGVLAKDVNTTQVEVAEKVIAVFGEAGNTGNDLQAWNEQAEAFIRELETAGKEARIALQRNEQEVEEILRDIKGDYNPSVWIDPKKAPILRSRLGSVPESLSLGGPFFLISSSGKEFDRKDGMLWEGNEQMPEMSSFEFAGYHSQKLLLGIVYAGEDCYVGGAAGMISYDPQIGVGVQVGDQILRVGAQKKEPVKSPRIESVGVCKLGITENSSVFANLVGGMDLARSDIKGKIGIAYNWGPINTNFSIQQDWLDHYDPIFEEFDAFKDGWKNPKYGVQISGGAFSANMSSDFNGNDNFGISGEIKF